MPLVTLAIPNYNYGRFLRQCVDSALAQDADIEVLVADNCSTDDSVSILESYSDPRLRWWRNPTNLGVYPSWDRLFHEARSEFFKILQSDDWLESDYLSTCLDALHQTGADHCFPGFRLTGDQERTVLPADHALAGRYVTPTADDLASRLWGLVDFVHPTVGLYRRALLPEGFGGTARHMNRDMVFWARALVRGKSVFVNEPLAVQRIHGAQDRRRADMSMSAGDLLDATEILKTLSPSAVRPMEEMARFHSVRFARSALGRLGRGQPGVGVNILRQLYARGRLLDGYLELARRPSLLRGVHPRDFMDRS